MNTRVFSISAGEIGDISNGDVLRLVDAVTNKELEFYHRGIAVSALGFALKVYPEQSVVYPDLTFISCLSQQSSY